MPGSAGVPSTPPSRTPARDSAAGEVEAELDATLDSLPPHTREAALKAHIAALMEEMVELQAMNFLLRCEGGGLK